jgi:phospholipase C
VGQFLEKRFGVTIPAISPWNRAVCGDLLSAFDFATPNKNPLRRLPDTHGSVSLVAEAIKRPKPVAPAMPEGLFQEQGVRPSRALPYVLHVDATVRDGALALDFRNEGRVGAVFHVYDRLHLDRIPRRYTVEAGKQVGDIWQATEGSHDLWVLGPNGFLRTFQGELSKARLHARLAYDPDGRAVVLNLKGAGKEMRLSLVSDVYGPPLTRPLRVAPGSARSIRWDVQASGNWYDVTLRNDGFVRRFAGRLETARDGVSDPAMHTG